MKRDDKYKIKKKAFLSLLIKTYIGYIFGCIVARVLIQFDILQLFTLGLLFAFLLSILFPSKK